MKTSQRGADAKQELELLEQTEAALEQIAFPSTENPPGTTEVIVLPPDDFDELLDHGVAKKGAAGFFHRTGPRYASHPSTVVRGDMGDDASRILQHELTHRFVSFHCPNAPTWFNEGLATFWETLEIQGGVARFGGALSLLVKPTPLEQLLQLRGADFYAGDISQVRENYVGAVVLTDILYFKHGRTLNQFLNALKSGQQSARDAWDLTGDDELPGICADFDAFFNEQGTLGSLAAPAVQARADIDVMSPAEVRLTWASAWPSDDAHAAFAMQEVSTALDLDPESLDALLLRAFNFKRIGRADDAHRDIERALALGPFRRAVIALSGEHVTERNRQRLQELEAALRRRSVTP